MPIGCEAPSPKMTFARWDSDGEEEYVTRSMAIYPEFKYIEDSDTPRFTLESGTYSEPQMVGLYSLSANTKIYYCVLDNTIPSEDGTSLTDDMFAEYNSPIVIEKSSIVFAYAVSPEKNNSFLVSVSVSIGDEAPTGPSTEEPPTVEPTNPNEGEVLVLGDTDGDGEVTIIDATCIQRHLAELPTFAFVEKAADSDEDGEVTIIDATCIQRHLAELPTNEKIGKPIKTAQNTKLGGG